MKFLRNERGYALLVVLLLVVLMLGLSTVFMAGSMNHAKQEQTVDAGNQAVASAEMGVVYYSADFQREIGIIKSEIIELTQNRIKSLVDCFNSGNSICDDQNKLTALEQKIDRDMKVEYIDKIYQKVGSLLGLEETPFPLEDSHYKVTDVDIIDRDQGGVDISQAAPSLPLYENIRSLEVHVTLIGESKGSIKELKGIFTVDVPLTFLSNENKLTVKTVTKTVEMAYGDIFFSAWPTKTCESLINDIQAGAVPLTDECVMGQNERVKDFVSSIQAGNLEPENFRVFTQNFKESVCEGKSNCNSTNLEGITVVRAASDQDNNGNMNNLNNTNLIIDGHFQVDQLQNLGSKSESQTMILRELTVEKNMHGQGLENTNLLILGNEGTPPVPNGSMDFKRKMTIGDNGRICFDMDRIQKSDWEKFRDEVDFKNNNTTGQIVYYTSDLSSNRFILPSADKLSSAERTKLYVQGYDNYTNFLSTCGVSVSQTVDEITDVPVPYVIDPEFELDVEY